MDKAQVAWRKIEERVQSCFLASCLKYGLEAFICSLPQDMTEEELNFCMSDYASLQWGALVENRDYAGMDDYIIFCRDRVRAANDFGLPL